MEPQRVQTCKDAVAGEHEVLGTEGAGAFLIVLQQQVQFRQVGAAHEGRVGDGNHHGHRGVAGLSLVGVERDSPEVRLVLEGLRGEGHRDVRRGAVAVVVEAGVDDGVL